MRKKNQRQRERPRENLSIKHVKWKGISMNIICGRTMPHPLPKEQQVTLCLRHRRKKCIGRKVAVPPDTSMIQGTATGKNLGCKFFGNWSKMRTLLHCTRVSIFWFHKLSSEDVTLSPPPMTRHSIPPLKSSFCTHAQGGLPVNWEGCQPGHIHSSALGSE